MKLKDLLDTARDHLSELTEVPEPDFRLEQAVFQEEEDLWDVVVSFLVIRHALQQNKVAANGGGSFFLPEYERVYKRLKIDSNQQVQGFYLFNAR